MTIQKAKLFRAKRINESGGIVQSSSDRNFSTKDVAPNAPWQTNTQPEEHFRLLFKTMLQGVVYKDAAGRVIAMNPAAERILGKSSSDFLGTTSMDVEHHTLREDGLRFPGIKHPSMVALQTGEEVRDVVMGVFNPREKAYRWINIRAVPLFRPGEAKPYQVYTIFDDITERKRAEEVLRQSERQYRTLFDTLIEGFCTIEMIFDAAGKPVDYRFLEVNPAFEKQTGLRHAQGRLMRDLAPNHEAHWFEVYGKIALTGEPAHFENEARALGRTYDVYAYRIGGPDSRKVAILFNDITEHKRAEKLLRNANRTLQVIRDCHEVMLRAATERELLDEICRIIVETGGERMVWVGFAEKNRGKTVRPVANAGVNMDYVARARITWADTPRGRGPVGTAIRTGKVCLCHNTQTDLKFALWREGARQCGYGSVIALPLIIEKKCLGALCIYAPEPDAFDAGEQLLLTDLANDLAFGIATLRLRAGRERLEKEIVQSIEGEQERIGRDLHDGICQMLVGAKFRSVYLEKILDGKFPAAALEAKALEELLNHAVEQTRNLSRGLNPVKVSSGGLELALQKLAASVENNRGPHCFCHFPKPVKVADHNAANQLYRIAQEAVQNAVKHAAAKNISITLVRQDRRVTLTVKDDGRGIPVNLTKHGMGLDNMHTRAKIIGGELEIRRRKHGGTAVTCRLSPTSGAKP